MKCVISGCIKDGGKYIKPVFENIRQIMTLFEETKIVVSYDESKDNTMEELLNQQKELPNMIILTNPEPLTKIRTLNIANARNRILDFIKENCVDYEYFIMMDLDNVCASKVNLEVLKNSFLRTDWDGLSFNNRSYYDAWALAIDFLTYSCWHWKKKVVNDEITVRQDIANIMNNYIIGKINKTKSTDLVECFSAFNGFAIYRMNKFINCRYRSLIDLSYYNKDDLEKASKYFNSEPIISPNIHDCEHKNFHFDAIKNNNAKIRISPQKLFGKIILSQ